MAILGKGEANGLSGQPYAFSNFGLLNGHKDQLDISCYDTGQTRNLGCSFYQ
ncbi:MAG: hypothetical protein IPH94_21595 [Saprospiraceae bacterium]|nr:hypothetical protein [Saprospiraceae bacterium]